MRYDASARVLVIEKDNKIKRGHIVVSTAGTADIPVAEEAAQTAEFFGAYVERIYDVGGGVACIACWHIWTRSNPPIVSLLLRVWRARLQVFLAGLCRIL